MIIRPLTSGVAHSRGTGAVGLPAEHLCYGLNVCVPPNSYIEALTPKVMVLGGGAFGMWLGLDEVVRVGPYDGISALVRTGRDQSLVLLCQV